MKKALLLSIFASFLLLNLLAPPGEAGWFSEKVLRRKLPQDPAEAAVQTYQPPPPDAMETRCEPLRKKVFAINSQPGFFRALNQPQALVLIGRHKRCVAQVEEEKRLYLKHVNLRKAPQLEPLEQGPQPPEKQSEQ